MTFFANWKEELTATQLAADELLKQVASGSILIDEQALMRLDKLATTCAKLAYGANSPSSLTETVQNLVTWCDHLNELEWRERFITALRCYPLGSPWQRT